MTTSSYNHASIYACKYVNISFLMVCICDAKFAGVNLTHPCKRCVLKCMLDIN